MTESKPGKLFFREMFLEKIDVVLFILRIAEIPRINIFE